MKICKSPAGCDGWGQEMKGKTAGDLTRELIAIGNEKAERRRKHLESLARMPADERGKLMVDDSIPSPNNSKGATEDIYFECKALLRELGARAAAPDNTAAEYLLDIARKAVRDLSVIVNANPQCLSWRAATLNDWPLLIPRNKSLREEVLGLLDRIGLGKKSAFKWQGKAFDATKPVNRLALELINEITKIKFDLLVSVKTIEANFLISGFSPKKAQKLSTMAVEERLAKKIIALPDFGGGCWKRWFQVAWELLLRRTGGRPENVESLRSLGEHRVSPERKKRYEARREKSFAEHSEIRTGIRGELRASFRRIAGAT